MKTTGTPLGPWPDDWMQGRYYGNDPTGSIRVAKDTPLEQFLIQENARLKAELAKAKEALLAVLQDVVGVYTQSTDKFFQPEDWQRMNAAMDKAKAVMHS